MHQAAGAGRIQRNADEVVRRGVAQVDDRVRDDGAHIDEAGGTGCRADRGYAAVRGGAHRGCRTDGAGDDCCAEQQIHPVIDGHVPIVGHRRSAGWGTRGAGCNEIAASPD